MRPRSAGCWRRRAEMRRWPPATRPISRQARPRSCWMMGLDGSSSAASRNGATASAGRPSLSNWVARASSGATCRGWVGFRGAAREPIVGDAAWRLYRERLGGVQISSFSAPLRPSTRVRNRSSGLGFGPKFAPGPIRFPSSKIRSLREGDGRVREGLEIGQDVGPLVRVLFARERHLRARGHPTSDW